MKGYALAAFAAGAAGAAIVAGTVLWWIWGPTAALAVLARYCL